MADPKAKEILKRYERLKGDRATTESHWQECANYADPDRADYTTQQSPGQKRQRYVFDQTPAWALEQFVAGMDSLLTSSTIPWFFLQTEDDKLNRNINVKMWLDVASAVMYAIFTSSRHNFGSSAQLVYSDQGLIGTACMSILESRSSGVLFSTNHMRECVIAEDDEDRVNTNIRRWQYTAEQAYKKWGMAAGEKVVKAVADNPDQKFWFLHSVRPRRQRDPERADNRNMAFESLYVGEADQNEISESGFQEFPYVTPRLIKKTSGELYGRSRTMTALPDIKMLMELVKLVVKGAQKLIDPPLDLPDNGYLMPLRTSPGALNFRRAAMRPDDRIQPITTGGQPELGESMLKDLRNSIMRTYYVDLLRMPTDISDPTSDGKGSTATYWLQRREKEMMALSPMFARSREEFLGPLIDRVFAILWRQSKLARFGQGSPFPPPPAELSGAKLRVEYVSPIAIAQKSSQLDSVQILMRQQLALKQIDPKAPTVLDMEEIMRLTAQDANSPASALKSPEQMQQEAAMQQQIEQAQAQHMQVQQLAGAAADGTKAIKNLADAGAANDGGESEAA